MSISRRCRMFENLISFMCNLVDVVVHLLPYISTSPSQGCKGESKIYSSNIRQRQNKCTKKSLDYWYVPTWVFSISTTVIRQNQFRQKFFRRIFWFKKKFSFKFLVKSLNQYNQSHSISGDFCIITLLCTFPSKNKIQKPILYLMYWRPFEILECFPDLRKIGIKRHK